MITYSPGNYDIFFPPLNPWYPADRYFIFECLPGDRTKLFIIWVFVFSRSLTSSSKFFGEGGEWISDLVYPIKFLSDTIFFSYFSSPKVYSPPFRILLLFLLIRGESLDPVFTCSTLISQNASASKHFVKGTMILYPCDRTSSAPSNFMTPEVYFVPFSV